MDQTLRSVPESLTAPDAEDRAVAELAAAPALAAAPRLCFSTLLEQRAAQHPAKTAFVCLDSDGAELSRHTYGELHAAVEAMAPALADRGLAGKRVLMLYDSGIPFVIAFLACLRAGVTPAPCHIARPGRASWNRLMSIGADADVAAILTEAAVDSRLEGWLATSERLMSTPMIVTDGLSAPLPLPRQPVDPNTVAFLQYTSGSTGEPKGTMVTFGNLRENAEICVASGVGPGSTIVCWLPAYHDLGLIGNILQALYIGGQCVLLPPMSVVRNPAVWLKTIDRYRGHMSAAPNFAFHLAARRIGADQKRGLDLSSWKMAVSASEPIRADTVTRFAEAFAECGFRPEHFRCSYGLAEATLVVTGGVPGEPPRMLDVEVDQLEHGRLVPRPGGRRLVSSGRPFPAQRVVIADPERLTPAPDGVVGEIWVSGPCVAAGYHCGGAVSAATFQARLANGDGPFLRTGDLGAMLDGELYVTGRCKEVIVVRGRKLFPQDVEAVAVESHPALRLAGAAAFGVDAGDGEAIVLVMEVERGALGRLDASAVCSAVREAVLEAFDVGVRDVVLVRPESVPKTTSGKIQRVLSRRLYLAGDFQAAAAIGEPATA